LCRNAACVLSADADSKYTFSRWVKEDMGVRRVGGQATMLPNGDTVLTGGSQGAFQDAAFIMHPFVHVVCYNKDGCSASSSNHLWRLRV
jgi:hypothetical protein